MGKLTEKEEMVRRDRTRPSGEESGEHRGQRRAETQVKLANTGQENPPNEVGERGSRYHTG